MAGAWTGTIIPKFSVFAAVNQRSEELQKQDFEPIIGYPKFRRSSIIHSNVTAPDLEI